MNCHLQFPFLVSSGSGKLASYLPSLSQARGCPHPLCAEIRVHLGWLCVDHSPSTAESGNEREEMTQLDSLLPHSSLFPRNLAFYLVVPWLGLSRSHNCKSRHSGPREAEGGTLVTPSLLRFCNVLNKVFFLKKKKKRCFYF